MNEQESVPEQGLAEPFFLWRQDDNGNRFLVDRFATREDAERRMETLARHPHKQAYWITGPPSTPT